MKRIKQVFVLLSVSMIAFDYSQAQEVIRLYEKEVPGNLPVIHKQEQATTDGGILRISKVSVPDIQVFQPAKPVKGRAAVIICPGGGYGILAAGHEGADVAQVLAGWGLTAVVLKYRLPDDSIMNNKSVAPLQDVQRAIQLVRLQAGKWGIDTAKVGVMGFSAGGHLAASAATWYSQPQIPRLPAISLRPDFSILIYPVISFTDSLTHKGSRNALLGMSPSAQQIRQYSNEKNVTSKSPPAFLVHAADDKAVKVENSLAYFEALQQAKVKAEIHIYQAGGHGFGMRNPTTGDAWMERLKNWLLANKLL